MSEIIRAEGLSKKFIISHEEKEKYTALRDVIAGKTKSFFSFANKSGKKTITKEEFWALKDVNFTINKGDRVGIIGRNGAGKSTLLKVLSRITEPTTGKVWIKGRVASLLEVGTGFHPELTGRENIFLNGAILGMTRAEIKRKFDEIVNFAEVEKFLDTPVKRYSSGMYVRLAFAVAAHLEPEILIVDEVLAVGDAQFQKKCLGKMEDVSKDGRTILFVSHNMVAIQNLCNSVIILNKGELKYNGEKTKGLIEFERMNKAVIKKPDNSETIVLFNFSCNNKHNPLALDPIQAIIFEVEIRAHKNYGKTWINIIIDDSSGQTIGHIRNDWYDVPIEMNQGVYKVTVEVANGIALVPGIYSIWARVGMMTDEVAIFDSEAYTVEVSGEHLYGNIFYKTNWDIKEIY